MTTNRNKQDAAERLERRDEFVRLCDSLPGSTIEERLQRVADMLGCSRTTARIWRCNGANRVIPADKLATLRTKVAEVLA